MPYKSARKTVQKSEVCSKRKQLCQELYQYCLIPNDKFKFETTFVKISEILSQLKEEEKSIPSCSSVKRTELDFVKFIEFLNDSNCKLDDNLTIVKNPNFDNDYSVKSKQQFKKGDLIFNVSNNVILTTRTIKQTQLGNLLNHDKLLSSMPNLALALSVLLVKLNTGNQFSKWTPYMNILPNEFHTPLYFSLDEIKLLKSSQSFYDVLYHIRNIARLYAYIFNLLESKKELENLYENFSYENFCWAVSVVSTRQNQIYDENQKQLLAMIPLLDMCNHEDGEFCTDFNDETKSALCYSQKDINIGDEITIFYGTRTNLDMLIHNGFVCESNPYDKVKLKFGLNIQDVLFEKRNLVLDRYGLKSTEYYEISTKCEKYYEIIPKLFVFVKIFTTRSEDELNEIESESCSGTLETYFQSKHLESDKSIVEFLVQRITILIKSIEMGLKNSTASTNSLFIQRLLISEKSILQSFLGYLSKN